MQINWIPETILKTKGKLGLTNMPGNRQPRDKDLDELAEDGVQHIVCLQKPHEFQQISLPETVSERQQAIEARNMKFLHEPIGDFTAPTLQQAHRVVDEINQGLGAGETIVTHCFAGLGRAGTIAACVLVSHGYEGEAAVNIIRHHRKGAIQTQGQFNFVLDFEANLKANCS